MSFHIFLIVNKSHKNNKNNFVLAHLSVLSDFPRHCHWHRQQFVSISSFRSPTSPLSPGVPHGSVFGPFLFIIYILPLRHIIRQYGFNFQSLMFRIRINLRLSSPATFHKVVWNEGTARTAALIVSLLQKRAFSDGIRRQRP